MMSASESCNDPHPDLAAAHLRLVHLELVAVVRQMKSNKKFQAKDFLMMFPIQKVMSLINVNVAALSHEHHVGPVRRPR